MILFSPDGLMPLVTKKLSWLRRAKAHREPHVET
jgi:hypothetical protein